MTASAPPAPTATDRPRVLCVDDEQYVLDGLRDTLRRGFDVWTASSGLEGLETLRRHAGSFAIVISDMRMPKMSGATFLRSAQLWAPDAAKMLLTGDADLEEAIRVVNSAQLFRFLTKPCAPEELRRACAAALGQHTIKTAERQLLEQTLRGSVNALSEALAIANPAAFGRSSRIKPLAVKLAQAAGLADWWEVEVAATLADLGAVSLPVATAEKFYRREPLDPDEAAMVQRVPLATRRLLARIPRLDGVLDILAHFHDPSANGHRHSDGDGAEARDVPVGAHILRIVADFDDLVSTGTSSAVAVGAMRSRPDYHRRLLDVFSAIVGARDAAGVAEVTCVDLRIGMSLADDVRSIRGSLLVARGQPVTEHLIERLENFAPGFVREPLRVFVEPTRT